VKHAPQVNQIQTVIKLRRLVIKNVANMMYPNATVKLENVRHALIHQPKDVLTNLIVKIHANQAQILMYHINVIGNTPNHNVCKIKMVL
jgi:hypothetical protein